MEVFTIIYNGAFFDRAPAQNLERGELGMWLGSPAILTLAMMVMRMAIMRMIVVIMMAMISSITYAKN